MNLETNKILNVEIVQSSQVKSSNHMELKGLQETLTVLDQFKIKIKSLVTDQHKQITKWFGDHHPGIRHFLIFGIHVLPKILSLAKKNACQMIGSWMKSIVDHFYWSVMLTQIDNKDLVEAKWKSVLNHT